MNTEIDRLQDGDSQSAIEFLKKFGVRFDISSLQKFLACDRNFFVTASISGAPAGWAYGYELVRPDHGSMLFLYSLDVLPQYRRRGVATALLSFLLTLAKTNGMKELFVFTTRSNNPATALYNATGGTMPNGDDLLFIYPTDTGAGDRNLFDLG